MTAAKPYTKKELSDFRSSLAKERDDLTAQVKEIEDEAFSSTQAEMSGESGFDEEFADAGSHTLERESALSIENNVRDLIQKIEGALERLDAGTFGACERCGKPIEKARIKALPYANLCIKDAQAESRLR